jgi:hypothetical protein
LMADLMIDGRRPPDIVRAWPEALGVT